MLTILVADDEINILNLFKIRLENHGYNVLTARDGREAIDVFYNNSVDLIIMDIMMPRLNGYDVIDTIRSDNYNTPVIMVSAKGELDDKREGFSVGADDYMVKPIEFDELLLRIQALVRRYKIVADKKITVGNVVLDYNTLTISNEIEGKSINLSKKEFSILFKLLSYPERAFTKEQLFDEFWGIDAVGDTDSVKVYISKIRSQIAIFPEIDITTIRGIGYRGVKNEG